MILLYIIIYLAIGILMCYLDSRYSGEQYTLKELTLCSLAWPIGLIGLVSNKSKDIIIFKGDK